MRGSWPVSLVTSPPPISWPGPDQISPPALLFLIDQTRGDMIVIIQCSQFWSASEIKFWISAQYWPIIGKYWLWQPIAVFHSQSRLHLVYTLWLELALLLDDRDEILGQIFFSLIEIQRRVRSITLSTHHKQQRVSSQKFSTCLDSGVCYERGLGLY